MGFYSYLDHTFRLCVLTPDVGPYFSSEAMDEATTYIDSLLAEEKSPELEFGAVYTVRIVEIEERGVKVEIHPTIPLVFVSNAQLDAKKVMHPRLAHLIKLLLFSSPETW